MPVLVGALVAVGFGAFVKFVRYMTKTLSQGPTFDGDTVYDNYADPPRGRDRHSGKSPRQGAPPG
jgi:hypothetical protein